VPNRINTNQDTFTWVTPVNNSSVGLERASAQRVGVFPNPYYAFNPAETNRFGRFVTFNNLPQKALIRIFSLAGEIVQIIEKDDPSQFVRWNFTNQGNLPVASGVYLAHIEMTLSDGSIVTKVLKVAVILEQEILEFY
jgi:hypothetical protein